MEKANNNDLIASPLDWIRLGYVLGESIKNISKIGICSDDNEMSKLVADTIKIGSKCSGSKVYNFGEQNLPIMRDAVRFYKMDYGVYVNTAKVDEGTRLYIDILDKRGTKISLDDVISESQNKFEAFSIPEFRINELGVETNLFEFKTYYIRHIINSIKSEKFNKNMCLFTKSKTVSEILETVLEELYLKIETTAIDKYEFSGNISEDGENITLFKSDGTKLTKEQMLSIIIYVLLRDSTVRTFVLPDYVSEYTETAILKMGGNVIRVSGDDKKIMDKMLSSGSSEQLLMQYDGIYAAVKILDFLNRYELSFDNLTFLLPQIFKSEAEVKCDKNEIPEILNTLKRQYRDGATMIEKKQNKTSQKNTGIKIESGGGITLVFPDMKNSVLKIVSESESFEAAEEISALFKNKIKTLANK